MNHLTKVKKLIQLNKLKRRIKKSGGLALQILLFFQMILPLSGEEGKLR